MIVGVIVLMNEILVILLLIISIVIHETKYFLKSKNYTIIISMSSFSLAVFSLYLVFQGLMEEYSISGGFRIIAFLAFIALGVFISLIVQRIGKFLSHSEKINLMDAAETAKEMMLEALRAELKNFESEIHRLIRSMETLTGAMEATVAASQEFRGSVERVLNGLVQSVDSMRLQVRRADEKIASLDDTLKHPERLELFKNMSETFGRLEPKIREFCNADYYPPRFFAKMDRLEVNIEKLITELEAEKSLPTCGAGGSFSNSSKRPITDIEGQPSNITGDREKNKIVLHLNSLGYKTIESREHGKPGLVVSWGTFVTDVAVKSFTLTAEGTKQRIIYAKDVRPEIEDAKANKRPMAIFVRNLANERLWATFIPAEEVSNFDRVCTPVELAMNDEGSLNKLNEAVESVLKRMREG
jgi:hypothetical protein